MFVVGLYIKIIAVVQNTCYYITKLPRRHMTLGQRRNFVWYNDKISMLFQRQGRRPQFRLLAKYIHKTVRTDTDRARYDWLLLMIKY